MTSRASPGRRGQAGQSMTEFIVAMIVLLPLFLAVSYAGRFGDLQQRATQASRYAAFERAMQPDKGTLSDAKLQDQMRARFFARQDALHGGLIQSDDTAAGMGKNQQEGMWRDMKGDALLVKPDDVKLTFADAALDTSAVKSSMAVLEKAAGKSWTNGQVAQVEVQLMNKLDLGSTAPKSFFDIAPAVQKTFTIAAATAAAGNALGSSGSKATRDAAATIVPTSYIPKIVDSVLEIAGDLFEPRGPQLGCIKPDEVPTDRLVGYEPVEGCM